MSDDLLRDLVEGERAALVPDDAAAESTWNAVAHSVAVGAPVPGFGGSPAVAPSMTLSLGKGLAVLALTGAAFVGVYAMIGDDETPPPAFTPAAAPRVPPDASSPPRRGPASAVEAQVPPAEDMDADAPTTAPREATKLPSPTVVAVPPSRSTPASAVATPEPTPPSALAEEARLVADARRKLAAGRAREALAVLRDHATRFPAGQLREERMALEATAHCRAGDREAGRRIATRLRDAHPASSHLERVDAACSE